MKSYKAKVLTDVKEATEEMILIKDGELNGRNTKDWDKLFAEADTTPEKDFKEWDVTLEDGIK